MKHYVSQYVIFGIQKVYCISEEEERRRRLQVQLFWHTDLVVDSKCNQDGSSNLFGLFMNTSCSSSYQNIKDELLFFPTSKRYVFSIIVWNQYQKTISVIRVFINKVCLSIWLLHLLKGCHVIIWKTFDIHASFAKKLHSLMKQMIEDPTHAMWCYDEPNKYEHCYWDLYSDLPSTSNYTWNHGLQNNFHTSSIITITHINSHFPITFIP